MVILSYKSLNFDDAVYCIPAARIKEVEYVCGGGCTKKDLKEVEAELFKLSDYQGCLSEHNQMLYYLENVV